MPVIGRLDEQVARVLIASVEGKRDETNAPPNTKPQMQDAAIKSSESKHDDQTHDRRQTLPVWML